MKSGAWSVYRLMQTRKLQAIWETALSAHQDGDLATAQTGYEHLLALEGNHLPALVNLATILRLQGRSDDAARCYRHALSFTDNSPELWFNYGNLLQSQGEETEAINAFKRALEIRPELFQARLNLANTLRQSGQLEAALVEYQHAIELRPDEVAPRTNAGNVLRRLGRLDEAIRFHRLALNCDFNSIDVRINLGNALRDTGRLEEAELVYRYAVRLSPQSSSAVIALIQLLIHQGREDDAQGLITEGLKLISDPELWALAAKWACQHNQLDEAEGHYQRALAGDPHNPKWLNSLAAVLAKQGKVDAAIENWRQLLQIDPQHASAHLNLGTHYRLLRLHNESIDHLRRAVELGSKGVSARVSLAHSLVQVGANSEAEKHLQALLAEAPDHAEVQLLTGYLRAAQGRISESIEASMKACALAPDNITAASNALFASLYSDTHTPEQISELHRKLAQQIAASTEMAFPRTSVRRKGRLRIGYLSPDLRSHPVAFFLEPILAHHDKARFEVFAYALLPVEDVVNQRLRGHADHWYRCHAWNDDKLGKQIQEDGIDLLIDLAGHTAYNRAALLCRRPAPVQAVYLGYPCTTGLPGIDYLIGDEKLTPDSEAALYSEQLAPICGYSFLSYQPQPDVPRVSALPAEQAGYISFGSFNNLSKLSQTTVALWARLLKAVPAARLILKAQGLSDAGTRNRVQVWFTERGIAAERLELLGPTIPQSRFMAEYERIDIGLDPYPYNGGTTTCDALWMGVPVISLMGRHLQSRMGASLLHHVGLNDLVAESEEQYLSIAVQLASDIPRLAILRKTLRKRVSGSSLGDAEGFTRALESLYLRITSAESVSRF